MDSEQAKAWMPLAMATEARACLMVADTQTVCHDFTTHGRTSASSPCCFLRQNCLPSSLPQPLFCLLILQGLTPLHLPLLKLSPATRVFVRHLLPTTSDPLVLTVLRSVSFQLFVGLTGFFQRQLPAHLEASLQFVLGCPCAMPRCAQPKSIGESLLCARNLDH